MAFGLSLASHVAKMQKTAEKLKEKYGDDFAKNSGDSFNLTVAEARCINDWAQSLVPEILAKQRKDGTQLDPGDKVPYYGAVGGGLTYCFTPTSLGTILVVKETITGKELNVSNALDWYFYD